MAAYFASNLNRMKAIPATSIFTSGVISNLVKINREVPILSVFYSLNKEAETIDAEVNIKTKTRNARVQLPEINT